MRMRLDHRPSPALVVAVLALVVALGGTGYAASHPSPSVQGAKKKPRPRVLRGPRGDAGPRGRDGIPGRDGAAGRDGAPGRDSAPNPNAINAQHANTADSAGDSATLGGVPAGGYEQTTAQAGQLLRGAFSVRYPANTSFVSAAGSFAVPLPPGTPVPTYHYVNGSSDPTCPGIGEAPSGTLCLYAYNSSNLHFSQASGNANQLPQSLYGWSFDAVPTTAASTGYINGSWAYRVP